MEKIKRYPSIASLALHAEQTGADKVEERRGGSRPAWFGHETAADTLAKARRGDTALVPEAERLIAQLAAEIDVPERPWIADCAGAYPVVPDFLAGMPDCMRRRDTVEHDESPVRIFVCLTSSGSLKAEAMSRRGCAILALVMALSRIRPVELNVFSVGRRGEKESVIVAPINTAPLDLATACYVLTSAGFTRRLCYGLAQKHHFGTGGIKWPERYGADDYLPGLLRRLGGHPETDLIIDAATAWDALISDPVPWINARLARYRGEVA
jgi:hypothetical protein